MNYELSICIPTYNRAVYLVELLKSILRQFDDQNSNKIEICISDNASTDNTKNIIDEYVNKYKNIKYRRNHENLGFDKNVMSAVLMASGKYCWLFGSDDIMCEGAINKILFELQYGYDVYFFNRIDCDAEMNIKGNWFFMKENVQSRIFHFGTDDLFTEYLESIKNMGGLFDYLSTTLFKKSKWDSVEFDEDFIGTAYSYTSVILSFLKKEATLKYMRDFLVMYRIGNDNFSASGAAKRAKIDFDGFNLLFFKIFNNDSKFIKYYVKYIKKHYSYRHILAILINSNIQEREELIHSARFIYNKNILNFLVVFALSLRFLYRKTFKNLIASKKT